MKRLFHRFAVTTNLTRPWWLIWLLSAIVAITSGFLIRHRAPLYSDIIVAKHTLDQNHIITHEDIISISWPQSLIPPGSVVNEKMLLDKTLNARVYAHLPIINEQLNSSQEMINSSTQGLRLITLPLDENKLDTGLLHQGDFVDLWYRDTQSNNHTVLISHIQIHHWLSLPQQHRLNVTLAMTLKDLSQIPVNASHWELTLLIPQNDKKTNPHPIAKPLNIIRGVIP